MDTTVAQLLGFSPTLPQVLGVEADEWCPEDFGFISWEELGHEVYYGGMAARPGEIGEGVLVQLIGIDGQWMTMAAYETPTPGLFELENARWIGFAEYVEKRKSYVCYGVFDKQFRPMLAVQ